MSTVNFSDTTPAQPAGALKIKFLSDVSGNISAYAPIGVWAAYVPGISAAGGMTIPGSNFIYARYVQLNTTILFDIEWQGSFGGTAAPAVTFTLPAPFVGSGTVAGWGHVQGPTAYWGLAVGINAGNATANLIGQIFALASTYNIRVSGSYPMA